MPKKIKIMPGKNDPALGRRATIKMTPRGDVLSLKHPKEKTDPVPEGASKMTTIGSRAFRIFSDIPGVNYL